MISNKLVETNKQISGNLTIGLKLNEKQNPVVGNKTIKKYALWDHLPKVLNFFITLCQGLIKNSLTIRI